MLVVKKTDYMEILILYTDDAFIVFEIACSLWTATYRKISSMSRTKSQNLNVFHLVLQLSLPNPLKLNIKLGIKLYFEQRRQAMLQLHLSYQQVYRLRCDLY